MKKLALAIALTAQAFRYRTDRGGKPYILHCIRVMMGVSHLGADYMCAGILHDLIEDTNENSDINYTTRYLRALGFNDAVITAVELLTHDKKEPYQDYIKRLSFNVIATAVKKADLKDNSDFTRLKGVTKKDHERMEKYAVAYNYLSNSDGS